MKTLFRLFIGMCLVACVTPVRAELSPVPFVVGKQQFKSGDSIVIDRVLASSSKFEVGAKIVVRGHYRLASATKARLGLFLTHRSAAGADASSSSQFALADSASGSFEMSCDITHEGDPHVSFYPASGGESFGGVYFSATAQKS